MATTRTGRSPRRAQALSRERIVEAAVELLDATGEGGLTFRALTEHLATGPGAIYWHVANKGELLAAATDAVVGDALADEAPASSPHDEIRAVALRLFDAIDEHPWLATQLANNPFGSVTPRILERIGRQVRALGVPEDSWFTATSVLVQYVVGAASQNAVNAVNARMLKPNLDRDALLDAASKEWEELDPDQYPFTRAIAHQMREHDDRDQFLAGVDLVLTGMTARYPPNG